MAASAANIISMRIGAANAPANAHQNKPSSSSDADDSFARHLSAQESQQSHQQSHAAATKEKLAPKATAHKSDAKAKSAHADAPSVHEKNAPAASDKNAKPADDSKGGKPDDKSGDQTAQDDETAQTAANDNAQASQPAVTLQMQAQMQAQTADDASGEDDLLAMTGVGTGKTGAAQPATPASKNDDDKSTDAESGAADGANASGKAAAAAAAATPAAQPATDAAGSFKAMLDGMKTTAGKAATNGAATAKGTSEKTDIAQTDDTKPAATAPAPLPASAPATQGNTSQAVAAMTQGTASVASGKTNAAAQPDAPATATQSHPMPNLHGLAMEITAKSQSGAKQFDIRLDPPELGHVEVRLSIDATGKAEAHLSADQPQTLELLQKDASTLTRALRDAGLDVSQGALNFSLKSQSQQADTQDGGSQNSHGGASRAIAAGKAIETATGATSAYSSGLGLLDIKV